MESVMEERLAMYCRGTGQASTCAADTGETCSLHLYPTTVPFEAYTFGIYTVQGIMGAADAPGIAIVGSEPQRVLSKLLTMTLIEH
eukprot:m.1109573 g.1109573  ORF g.1109573 m.1109573 type:complete len:86 (-) comp24353_c0_seq15:194-451(-)